MDQAHSGPEPDVTPGSGESGLNGDGHAPDDKSRLERLPPEIGALLMVVGVAGMVLPGPVGSPFFIAGGVALWPAAFGRVEKWFQRRFPFVHRKGLEQIGRYLDDLEKRFPGSLG
jgi:hypothetical protein